jgi:A/G-specific adenine glycosylase
MTLTRKVTDGFGPALGEALLAWYDRHARVLPWRAPPGRRADPYQVWLSEIMLQQTTVATVGPYFARFTQRWPDVAALAAAAREDVLAAWAGLGYYARARNLHACARQVVDAHGGSFPDSEATLRALPGIGPYTAGAIAAIAFDRPSVAVDGNVERVITRLAAIATPLPAAKSEIRAIAAALLPVRRPGDFAQAMMDLGATLCTPRAPACGNCPWRAACRARAAGTQERFPVKAPKRTRPQRRGVAFVLRNAADEIWLTRRPERGLLAGMAQVPTTAWELDWPDGQGLAAGRPQRDGWRRIARTVRHVFTHFELELAVEAATARQDPADEGRWWPLRDIAAAGLPSVFRKVVAAAVDPPTGAPPDPAPPDPAPGDP